MGAKKSALFSGFVAAPRCFSVLCLFFAGWHSLRQYPVPLGESAQAKENSPRKLSGAVFIVLFVKVCGVTVCGVTKSIVQGFNIICSL